MKIKIIIETNDKWDEYTLWPYWEREKQHESEVTIEIKSKTETEEEKIIKEISYRLYEKYIEPMISRIVEYYRKFINEKKTDKFERKILRLKGCFSY